MSFRGSRTSRFQSSGESFVRVRRNFMDREFTISADRLARSLRYFLFQRNIPFIRLSVSRCLRWNILRYCIFFTHVCVYIASLASLFSKPMSSILKLCFVPLSFYLFIMYYYCYYYF